MLGGLVQDERWLLKQAVTEAATLMTYLELLIFW